MIATCIRYEEGTVIKRTDENFDSFLNEALQDIGETIKDIKYSIAVTDETIYHSVIILTE